MSTTMFASAPRVVRVRGLALLAFTAIMAGCSSVQTGQVPVVDATAMPQQRQVQQVESSAQSMPLDSYGSVSGSVTVGTGVSGSTDMNSNSGADLSSGSDLSSEINSDINSEQSGVGAGGAALSGSAGQSSLPSTSSLSSSSPAVLALLSQSTTMASSGDLGQAISRAERALRLDPRDPNVYRTLMGLYDKAGQHDQAREMASRGLSVARSEAERLPFRARLAQ
ncbi:tetratricopeptide repeat protein [Pokkaliibacter plantistimulans]|uniref:tetratricopeptide repeat protein n=1 Tax=Pokkaliibacter plantistimulans TaxID=1635171 RepID=UPI001057DFA9|nr:tetratricopeptide repeat protein [Pokkaliibacter plantistimulans]